MFCLWHDRRAGKLAATVVVATLIAGTFQASAETMAITCVETVTGGTQGDPVTKSIRIDTEKLEVTVRQRGARTAEHYSNTTEKEKTHAANPLAAQILRELGVNPEKSVSITDNTVAWTSSQSWILFRAEYDRATNRLVEITSEKPHESVIKFAKKSPPSHEYACMHAGREGLGFIRQVHPMSKFEPLCFPVELTFIVTVIERSTVAHPPAVISNSRSL
jgi:hypothetical protein